jgi:hypothetical protein
LRQQEGAISGKGYKLGSASQELFNESPWIIYLYANLVTDRRKPAWLFSCVTYMLICATNQPCPRFDAVLQEAARSKAMGLVMATANKLIVTKNGQGDTTLVGRHRSDASSFAERMIAILVRRRAGPF